jgi:hypothetical protein
MKMQLNNKEFNFELLDGEYRRYVEEDGSRYGEYLCIGVCGANRVLFQYIDTIGESVDFVQQVIDNIPDFALEYLIDVLDKNINLTTTNERQDRIKVHTGDMHSRTSDRCHIQILCESSEERERSEYKSISRVRDKKQ